MPYESYKNLYKFISVLQKTTVDRLEDIEEFGNGKRIFKVEPKYNARIEQLQHLVKTYEVHRKTDDEKLRYLDAIVSVQLWEFVDDPDILDGTTVDQDWEC